MFLSSKNFEELNMLIDIDNYRFVSINKLEEVHEDIQKIMNLYLEKFRLYHRKKLGNLFYITRHESRHETNDVIKIDFLTLG